MKLQILNYNINYINYCFKIYIYIKLRKTNVFIVTTLFLTFYFILEYSWLTMLCQFQVYSKVVKLHIYIYLFFFKFFPHLGCYTIQNRVRCARQQVLTGYPFKYSSVYMSIPNSLLIPPHNPSTLVIISSFSQSCFYSVNKFICIIYFQIPQDISV